MSSVWNKIDPGLATMYSDYLWMREHGPPTWAVDPVVEAGARPHVLVHFNAELEELKALGFECAWREDENRARGAIDLADLERLAEHPGVHRILVGRELKPLLDKSVPDIRANALWTHLGDVFSGGTGAGAIVGIIDTGIDFRHEFFDAQGSTPAARVTRIRRIWDQGLKPQSGEKNPDSGLLSGATTYGVEYTEKHINDVLQGVGGAPDVRHRDCDGHGTHVASIAAGDGRTAFKYIGVAPRAGLVVVKLQDLQSEPTIAGSPVRISQRLKDAVNYILNVRAQLAAPPPPVAINCSFGIVLGPHDGFTDEEDWLTDKFAGATGQVLVAAAGNAGNLRQHAQIDLPAATDVEIPLELNDPRRSKQQFRKCAFVDETENLFVDLYYRHGGATLSAVLDLPSKFLDVDAPDVDDPPEKGTFASGQGYEVGHAEESVGLRAGRGTVTRNNLYFVVKPFRGSHETGTYKLTLTSTAPLTVHLWCAQGDGYGFKVAATGVPAEVTVEDRFLIGYIGGAANILTVANYNAESLTKPIEAKSSRGPLVFYGSGPAQPNKPDLAAPGFQIDAAKGRDRKPDGLVGNSCLMNGTSMSAPHVTGAVALMLAKKPTLAAAQVATILKSQVNNAPPVIAEEGGAGRLNAEKAFMAIPP